MDLKIIYYEYRVMYRHYDGTVQEWMAGLTREAAERNLPKRADDREWWIEKRPMLAWERL